MGLWFRSIILSVLELQLVLAFTAWGLSRCLSQTFGIGTMQNDKNLPAERFYFWPRHVHSTCQSKKARDAKAFHRPVDCVHPAHDRQTRDTTTGIDVMHSDFRETNNATSMPRKPSFPNELYTQRMQQYSSQCNKISAKQCATTTTKIHEASRNTRVGDWKASLWDR